MSGGGCVEDGDKEEKNSKQELRGMKDEERVRRYREMRLMNRRQIKAR